MMFKNQGFDSSRMFGAQKPEMIVQKPEMIVQKPDMIAPPEVLKEFYCTICKCLLSVPPIRWVEDKYVCGRCPGEGPRLVPLGKFASQFQFPCRYFQTGCRENLSWAQVDRHEQLCTYKSINCVVTDCACETSKLALMNHCKMTHAGQLLSAHEEIRFSDIKFDKYFYFIDHSTAFAIEIKISEELITYKVTVLWPDMDSSQYLYKIAFLNDEFNLTLSHQMRIAGGVPFHVEKKFIESVTNNFSTMKIQIKVELI